MGVADRLLLDVANRRRLSADVSRAVLGVERTGSMESKPGITVTIEDPRSRLMESRVLTRPAVRAIGTPAASTLRPIDLLLDGVWYRLLQAHREGDNVGLTFDHRGAVYMGEHDTPISASRNDRTRALFIRRQVDEVGRRRGAGHRLAFWAWEVRRRMPVAKPDVELSPRSEVERDPSATTERAKDLKGLKLRGHEVDAGQRRNIATAAAVADELEAGPKASTALFLAAIVEGPDFRNPTGGSGTSVGMLQLTDDHPGDRRDVARICRLFLTQGFTSRAKAAGGAIGVARKHPEFSAGQVAQYVQGSAFPDRYDAVRRDAERALEAVGGIAGREAVGGSYIKPYVFRRPRGEDAWTNTGNLAEEVGRRRFITVPARGADLFVYAADVDLLRLRSQAVLDMGARYVVGEPEYDLDFGKTMRAMRLSVLGDAFDADFAWGLPVTVENADPASGKWLVWDVHEVDGSPVVELELRMPQAERLEPAPERVQRADSGDSESDDDGSASSKVYSRAVAIGERNYPYVWGGGHAVAGRPDGGTGRDKGTGYDCSGYVAACLLAGGMLPDDWRRGVPGSGTFASSYGEAGEGERVTVWANSGHVFIEFGIKGKKGNYADTSRQAGGPAGPHVRMGKRSTAGFTARHWPGV